MIDKALTGNTCLHAYAGKDGCRGCIAGVLLCGIELDDRSAAQDGMIGGVVLVAIVRMPSVGIICRYHEGFLDSTVETLEAIALREDDALEDACQEGAAGSLLGLTAGLFVIEDGQHLCGLRHLVA